MVKELEEKIIWKKVAKLYSKIPYRIINILMEKGDMNIFAISSFIKTDYKNVYNYVMKFKEEGILSVTQLKNKQGRPVIVRLNIKD